MKKILHESKVSQRIDEKSLERLVNGLRDIFPSEWEALIESHRGVYKPDPMVLATARKKIAANFLNDGASPDAAIETVATLLMDLLVAIGAVNFERSSKLFRVGAGEPFLQWLLTPIQTELHRVIQANGYKGLKGKSVHTPIRTAYVPDRRTKLKSAIKANHFDIGIFRTPVGVISEADVSKEIKILKCTDFGTVAFFELEQFRKRDDYCSRLEMAKKAIGASDGHAMAGIRIGTYEYILAVSKQKHDQIVKSVKNAVSSGDPGLGCLSQLRIATRLDHLHLCKNDYPITMEKLLDRQFTRYIDSQKPFGAIVVQTDNFVEAKAVARSGDCAALVPDLALQLPSQPDDGMRGIKLDVSDPQELVVYAKLGHLISSPLHFEYWYNCASLASEYLKKRDMKSVVTDLSTFLPGKTSP